MVDAPWASSSVRTILLSHLASPFLSSSLPLVELPGRLSQQARGSHTQMAPRTCDVWVGEPAATVQACSPTYWGLDSALEKGMEISGPEKQTRAPFPPRWCHVGGKLCMWLARTVPLLMYCLNTLCGLRAPSTVPTTEMPPSYLPTPHTLHTKDALHPSAGPTCRASSLQLQFTLLRIPLHGTGRTGLCPPLPQRSPQLQSWAFPEEVTDT